MQAINSTLCYVFAYISVALLWIPKRLSPPLWSVALLLCIMLGLMSRRLELIALVPVLILAGATYYSGRMPKLGAWFMLAQLAILFVGFGLLTHRFPGFNNLKLIDHVLLSSNAIPYTMYLNLDKAMVGILILGLSQQLIASKQEWLALGKGIILKLPALIIVLIGMALLLGYVQFDVKIPAGIGIWVLTNLLFVCVAEEAFFRAFLQGHLIALFAKLKYGTVVAIVIASILFGLAHFAGGLSYIVLATVAGLGYGWIYYTTDRIEASILTHFAVNFAHYLFFTYPALAR